MPLSVGCLGLAARGHGRIRSRRGDATRYWVHWFHFRNNKLALNYLFTLEYIPMADTSDKAPFSPGARPLSPRVVTRQACDNCRIRKRKCSFASDEGIRWATVPCAPKPGTRCRNCTKADSQCTFLLPSKARGPKTRRNLHHNAAQHSVSPENSLNLDSDLVNQLSPFTTESSPSIGITAYATDILFPRELVRFILGDYVTYVYPLIPVIHQPTFQLDFDSDRDMHDVDFLALIISLCAVTVSLLPSRFKTYRSFSSPLPFETRTEMADQCYKLNQSFRDTTYFDTVSHQKWASTFLLGVAFHQTVNNNLWRMLEVESMQLLRLLEVQHLSSYSGLDAVEIQLRKKAFWLMFYGYVHQMYNLRNERLMFLDPTTLSDLDIEGLMPNAVDDEFISCTGVLPCPEDVASKSLTAGFNIHSRVFAAAVISPRLTTHPAPDLCHPKDPVSRLDSLKNRLHHLKYMLDTIVPAYRPWLPRTHDPDPEGDTDVVNVQREAIRVNIHVTHLWLQSVLLDQIDLLAGEKHLSSLVTPSLVTSSLTPTSRLQILNPVLWDEREHICRQLLHFLHSMSHSGLESNGISLVSIFISPQLSQTSQESAAQAQ